MASNLYYDESLFVDGIAIKNYDPVGVSNRADEYLVKRYGKSTRPICAASQAAVNPVVPCKGVNIYTMSRRHRATRRVYAYSKIRVSGSNATTPITVGEMTPNVVYDYNKDLTPLEMAIMLKYHSMTLANRDGGDDDDDTPLTITRRLYHTVSEHFERADRCTDGCARDWFDTGSEDSVVQTPNREIVHRNRIINLPDLTFYGPEATIR